MKKFVSMLVVLSMLLSMVPAVFADEAAMSGTFTSTAGSICAADDWTAETDGVLTISVSSKEGVGYKVYINGEAQSLIWAMTYADTVSYAVNAGDRVNLEVRGYNPDTWQYCDATIDWAYSFSADGVVKTPYEIVMDGDNAKVIAAPGEHTVPMIATADVTIVTVSPEEAGVYTITVGEGATIANCGATSALISTDVDFGTSLEWTCQEAGYWTETEIPDEDWDTTGDMITIEQYISGQSLMLGIKSDSETVTVNVEKTGEYTVTEVELQTYVNKAELSAFTVPADATLGEYVDVYGDTHTAVLGDDGYYHLDSADGDILLVDMDYMFRLSSALEGGRGVMYVYVTDENGTVLEKWDIGAAVRAYEAVCDENGYYPVTEDLMFFYQDYAESNGVYSFALGENYNADCAWMYACLTMALPKDEAAAEITSGTYVLVDSNGNAPLYLEGTWILAATPVVEDGIVTDACGAVWTVTAVDGGVILTDSNGVSIAPKGGNNNGIKEGEYVWAVVDNGDGTYTFNGQGEDTVTLASNVGSENKYRGYKTTTVAGYPDSYPNAFTLYAVEETEEPEVPVEPEVPADPEADSVLTIAEAIELGSSKEHNTYTEGKYYVTGVITEVYNETYGNMKITDDAGNILTIYGTYDATGANRYDAMEVKPVAGDTVTVYGIIGQYNGTPQIKNGWITEHIPGEGEPEPEPEAPADPEADTVLTIAEAIELAATKDHNSYTAGKYYVTGVITEVYNETYGNMKITDDAGNILTVYGSYSADGSVRYDAMEVKPVAGDTVTVYGIIGRYYETPQIKNGWITEHIPAEDDTLAGSGTEEDPFIIPSLPFDITASFADEDSAVTGYIYQYTAEQDGVLEAVALEGYDMTGCFCEVESWAFLHDGEKVSVTAGQTYLFNLYAFVTGDFGLTLQYGEDSGEDPEDPGEDPEDPEDPVVTPDSGEWSGTDVAVAADEVITIVYTPETNGTLSVAVSCETGWQINVNTEFTGETAWSDTHESPVSFPLTAGTTYTIEIVPYDQADGWTTCDAVMTYELTWTAESTGSDVEGSGTEEDPYILVVDGYNYATIAAGEDLLPENIQWFMWVAEQDGTLTLTFDENDPQPWVTNYTNGPAGGVQGWTHAFDVKAGDNVYFSVETYDFCDAEYEFYAAFEAAGSGEEPVEPGETGELVDGANELFIVAGQGVTPYTYTATQSGTLYLTFTYFAYESSWGLSDCSDNLAGYFGNDPDYGEPNWMMLTINGQMADTYYGSVEVNAGDVISVGWDYYGANDYVKANYNMFATLDLNYEGFKIPEPGSVDDPYEMYKDEIDFGMGSTIEILPENPIYYILYGFDGSTATITGEGDFTVNVCTYVYDEMTWEETEVWNSYDAVNGVVEFYADGHQILISIENKSGAAASYQVGYYYPVGHALNPEIITGEGTWTATVDENSNGYYYTWNLGEDKIGLVTVTVGGESWQYYIQNLMTYESTDWHYSHDDPQVPSESLTIFGGEVFTFCVNTNHRDIEMGDYTTPAGEVTVTVTFEEKELVQGVDYPYAVSAYDVLPAEIPVPAGAEVWVEANGFSGYYLTVSGEGTYVVYNGDTYTDEDGDGFIKLDVADYTATLMIGNSSNADTVAFINYEIPVGHMENPEIITEDGTYTTSQFPDNGFFNYYFQYTAAENGTITVEILNENFWRFNMRVGYSATAGGNCNGDTNVFTMDVNAGDVVEITAASYDPSMYDIVEGSVSFNFSFEKEEISLDDAIALMDGDNAVKLDNLDSTQTPSNYVYTATQSGTLYLTMSQLTYVSYNSYSDSMSEPQDGKNYFGTYTVFQVNGQPLANGYFGTIEVTEGEQIVITWNMKYNYSWAFDGTLNLNYEGYSPAPGSEADPIELDSYDCPAQTIEIAAGETAYYILNGFYGQIITITGEGAYLVYNDVTYTDEDGDGVIKLEAADSTMAVQIGNSGDAAAVFTVNYEYPVGDAMNPEAVVAGDYTLTFEENDMDYYVAYTAVCDGILTVTISGDSWQYMISNSNGMIFFEGEWIYPMWGDYLTRSSGFEDLTNTLELEVMAGDVITIAVNTLYTVDPDDFMGLYGSSPAGSVNLSFAEELLHEDEDGDGICDICGAELGADILLGDVDGNGEIDIFDANLIVGYYNGTVDLTDEQQQAADVNGNGEIDIFDANLVIGYYNGTVEVFPAEED